MKKYFLPKEPIFKIVNPLHPTQSNQIKPMSPPLETTSQVRPGRGSLPPGTSARTFCDARTLPRQSAVHAFSAGRDATVPLCGSRPEARRHGGQCRDAPSSTLLKKFYLRAV